eukprot:893042-Rhodomonas_salina.1
MSKAPYSLGHESRFSDRRKRAAKRVRVVHVKDFAGNVGPDGSSLVKPVTAEHCNKLGVHECTYGYNGGLQSAPGGRIVGIQAPTPVSQAGLRATSLNPGSRNNSKESTLFTSRLRVVKYMSLARQLRLLFRLPPHPLIESTVTNPLRVCQSDPDPQSRPPSRPQR